MRRSRRPVPGARGGFTLVELLVAAALTVALMAILATAFQTGMNTLSGLKSVVGLSEQLRGAEAALRRDLSATHLEDATGGAVQVSDPRLNATTWASPGQGFFAVRQKSTPMQSYVPTGTLPSFTYPYPPNPAQPANYTATYAYAPYVDPLTTPGGTQYWYEGADSNAPSFQATDHVLAMTVKLSGKTASDVFAGGAPQGTPPANTSGPYPNMIVPQLSRTDLDPSSTQFLSPWAEVSYFLQPSPLVTAQDDTTSPSAPPLRLFTLYRRQRLLSPAAVTLATVTNVKQGNDAREAYPELSIRTNPAAGANTTSVGSVTSIVNTPADVTNSMNRQDAFVDWRDYPANTKPITPQVMLPSGVYEVGPTSPLYGSTPSPVPASYGSDVLLSNVLSFQVQVMTDASAGCYVDPPAVGGTQAAPAPPYVYDTASSGSRVLAVRIKLRVYDFKNKQTRQATIAQDL